MLLITTQSGPEKAVTKGFRAIHWHKALGYIVEKLTQYEVDESFAKFTITLEWE